MLLHICMLAVGYALYVLSIGFGFVDAILIYSLVYNKYSDHPENGLEGMNIPLHVNLAGEKTRSLLMFPSGRGNMDPPHVNNDYYSWPPLMFFLLETFPIRDHLRVVRITDGSLDRL